MSIRLTVGRAGVTDYVTYGEIQIRTAEGEWLETVPVGVSPGSLAWRTLDVSNLGEVALPVVQANLEGQWDALGRFNGASVPGLPSMRLMRTADGQVFKTVQVSQ